MRGSSRIGASARVAAHSGHHGTPGVSHPPQMVGTTRSVPERRIVAAADATPDRRRFTPPRCHRPRRRAGVRTAHTGSVEGSRRVDGAPDMPGGGGECVVEVTNDLLARDFCPDLTTDTPHVGPKRGQEANIGLRSKAQKVAAAFCEEVRPLPVSASRRLAWPRFPSDDDESVSATTVLIRRCIQCHLLTRTRGASEGTCRSGPPPTATSHSGIMPPLRGRTDALPRLWRT